MTELEVAERIARFAHADQVEESTGDPYVFHLERVVDLAAKHSIGLDINHVKIVAFLHDIVEDTNYTIDDLRSLAFSPDVCAAVSLLTRTPNLSYPQYIDRIIDSGNDLALVVKLADLLDHLRPNCPSALRPRYEAALTRITDAQRCRRA